MENYEPAGRVESKLTSFVFSARVENREGRGTEPDLMISKRSVTISTRGGHRRGVDSRLLDGDLTSASISRK